MINNSLQFSDEIYKYGIGDMITLTTTDPNGNSTSIEIPIGDFGI